MPEPSKTRKPQGGTPQSDALPVVLIPGRGVDIGTAYIAAGQMHDDNANMSQAAIRDCFITLPADEAPNLMMGGVDFRMSEDEEHCIVVGDAAIELAAIELATLGCRHVLIKGGHLEGGDSNDCLYLGTERRMVILPGERIPTRNNHGTGCTLSAAIASFIARGESVENAVRLAKDYISGAIRAGADYVIGHGHGPVHHFFRFF